VAVRAEPAAAATGPETTAAAGTPRDGARWLLPAGAALLVGYGIVPTYQPANFGRVYAAYGGVFVALSILWGWKIDHIRPDAFDLIGGAICVVGVAIIMYWPR